MCHLAFSSVSVKQPKHATASRDLNNENHRSQSVAAGALSLMDWFLFLESDPARTVAAWCFRAIFWCHDLEVVHFFVSHVWTSTRSVDSTIHWWTITGSCHLLGLSLPLLFWLSSSLDAKILSYLGFSRTSLEDQILFLIH